MMKNLMKIRYKLRSQQHYVVFAPVPPHKNRSYLYSFGITPKLRERHTSLAIMERLQWGMKFPHNKTGKSFPMLTHNQMEGLKMTELKFICPKCTELEMRAYNLDNNFPRTMKNINHLQCSHCGCTVIREWKK